MSLVSKWFLGKLGRLHAVPLAGASSVQVEWRWPAA